MRKQRQPAISNVMPHSRSGLRIFAISYAAAVGLVALWAWWIDFGLLNSEREHLLPNILFALLSMRSSLTMDWVYQRWPMSFNGLWQTAYFTACAFFQSGVLYLISQWWEKHLDA